MPRCARTCGEAAKLLVSPSAGCGEATQAKHHLDMGRKKKKKDEGELSLNPLHEGEYEDGASTFPQELRTGIIKEGKQWRCNNVHTQTMPCHAGTNEDLHGEKDSKDHHCGHHHHHHPKHPDKCGQRQARAGVDVMLGVARGRRCDRPRARLRQPQVSRRGNPSCSDFRDAGPLRHTGACFPPRSASACPVWPRQPSHRGPRVQVGEVLSGSTIRITTSRRIAGALKSTTMTMPWLRSIVILDDITARAQADTRS